MKKSALSILCFTLCMSLFAQPNANIERRPAGFASLHTFPHAETALLPDENTTVTTAATTEPAAASENISAAEGHGVPNKAYSVRGGVSYNTANGLRLSSHEIGISTKHFFKSNEALEVILSTGWQYTGGRLTGLYEMQRPIGAQGFYWIWGVGAHAGIFKGNYWTGNNGQENYLSGGKWYSPSSSRYTMGISGILGLEYHFAEAPFTIGIDLKPSMDLLGMSHRYGDGAISVRYAF